MELILEIICIFACIITGNPNFLIAGSLYIIAFEFDRFNNKR